MKIILLVEDNKEFANSCIEKLLSIGYQVEYADNAEKAKQIVLDKKIDIMIIDLMLPPELKIEGLNFYRFVKERKDIPAIFMTAKSFKTTEIVAEAMRLGANDFLDKDSEVFFDKLIFTVNNHFTPQKKEVKTNVSSSFSIILTYAILFIVLISILTLITYLITLIGLPFMMTFLGITTVTISLLIIIISSQFLNEGKIKERTWLKAVKRVENIINQLLKKL